jgi:hypothetical protein
VVAGFREGLPVREEVLTPFWSLESLVHLYPAVPFPASPAVPGGWPPELAGAGIVAVRVADLRLRDRVLAASGAEHEEHDYRAIEVGDLRLGSIDGSVTRMADTPANRAEFGSSGRGPMTRPPTRSCGTCRSPTPPPAACSPW